MTLTMTIKFLLHKSCITKQKETQHSNLINCFTIMQLFVQCYNNCILASFPEQFQNNAELLFFLHNAFLYYVQINKSVVKVPIQLRCCNEGADLSKLLASVWDLGRFLFFFSTPSAWRENG